MFQVEPIMLKFLVFKVINEMFIDFGLSYRKNNKQRNRMLSRFLVKIQNSERIIVHHA